MRPRALGLLVLLSLLAGDGWARARNCLVCIPRASCAVGEPCRRCDFRGGALIVDTVVRHDDGTLDTQVFWHLRLLAKPGRDSFRGHAVAWSPSGLRFPLAHFGRRCRLGRCRTPWSRVRGQVFPGARFAASIRFGERGTCELQGTLDFAPALDNHFTCHARDGRLLAEGEFTVRTMNFVGTPSSAGTGTGCGGS